MPDVEKVNILLVDDQPAKLIAYEVILKELNENLIKANSGQAALEQLLKTDIGVVLVDVSMPDLDGFQLVSMIREHPRYEKTAIIFVSAIHLSEIDTLRGYEKGAVDYVPVPVIPEVLRAKVRVFADLYRKTRQLERLNSELEERVAERTAELTAALDRQAILAREVDHRAKNALAVVQSIVRLTRADDVPSYVAAVEGRMRALSRAHDLLSHSRWEGANLGTAHRRGVGTLSDARQGTSDSRGSGCHASADRGSDACACAPRARDECREIRRTFEARRTPQDRVGSSAIVAVDHLDRKQRTGSNVVRSCRVLGQSSSTPASMASLMAA